jgi:C1A family cysteine protease
MRQRIVPLVICLIVFGLRAYAQSPGKGFVVPENAADIYEAQRALHLEIQQSIPPGVGAAEAKVCDPAARQFSWRDQGKVTSAKHQGSCGSCWAFSAVSAIETSYMVYHNVNAIIPDLSEQEVLDCAGQYRAPQTNAAYNCTGGWFEGPFRMAQTKGIVASVRYPASPPPGYRGTQNSCDRVVAERISANSWTPLPSVRGPNNWIAPKSEIKEALCTYGGVAAALSSDGFPGGPFNTVIAGPPSSSSPAVDHAIQIVGWDDDQGVWIIKNSWGQEWGDQGFAKIPYDTRKIGFMATAAQANTTLVVRGLPPSDRTNFLNQRENALISLPAKIDNARNSRLAQ